MKKYKHAKEKKPTERVSFYIALSVCMMAVGFAAWSAYSTFGSPQEPSEHIYFSSLSTENAAVAQQMTGITEKETQVTNRASEAPTEASTEPLRRLIISETMPDTQEDGDQDENTEEAGNEVTDTLQAVLKVKQDLIYPVKSQKVTKVYSEDGVYNSTLRDYRAHTGCDFAAEQGENVYAMCAGTVSDISVSELYGVIIEVDCGDFSVYYCGLDTDFLVEKDDEVSVGDTIGTVGQIPCESGDVSHVHIEIRVGDKLVDPLSVIDTDS